MNTNVNKKLIVLAGATASGKTALAAELIKKYPMEIVSADSRQVYKGLDIGTGKEKTVAQWMIDVVEPQKIRNPKSEIRNVEDFSLYSVAKYRDEALQVMGEIWKRGNIPLVVGGTGFYIDALIYEQTTNVTPPNQKIRAKLSKLNNEEMLAIIKKVDPETYAKIDHKNRARLIRAAEIVTITQKPIEHFDFKIRDGWDVQMFVLDINREELYRRIDKRVDDRLTEGMIEEVKGLIENGVSVTWLLSLGLEYRFITVYLMQNAKCKISSTGSLQVQNCGNYSYKSVISNTVRDPVGIEANEILRGAQDDSLRAQNDTHTRDEMILRLKFAIHAYARRQDTYFKRWPNAKWGDGEYITDQIEAYDELKSKKNYVV